MDRQDEWGDDGALQARLDAYAESRLDPDPAATARARSAVMAQAHAGRGTMRTAGGAAGTGFLGRLFRRPALAATAALLGIALVAGGTVAAATPGGPLYGARLWVESLTLPSDATARAAAELDRLQSRLDDATAAAGNGNGGAVTAALDAYRETLAQAFAAADEDPSRVDRLAAELGRHLAVLETLAAHVPPTAQAAIQQAAQRTEAKIHALTPAPAKPGQSPNPAHPNATPGTARPGKSPNPGQPTATPRPGNPNHTPNPGNPGRTPPAPGR